MNDLRQPLAVRLAVLLAVAVVVVLLVAGVIVNRVASRSLEDALTDAERDRLAIAVTLVEDTLERAGPTPGRMLTRLLGRVAQVTGGRVTLHDASGGVMAQAGRVPTGVQTDAIREPLSTSSGGGELEIVVARPAAGFLAAFNAALVIAGIASVLAIVVIASLAADRLTRPLRAVAAAAHRLGDGDLTARATGGSDRESSELASAFNAMAERIERSEMLRRRAASDVAHDLATPATLLESQLTAMLDGVVPADRAELEKARLAAGSLSGIVGQLGELASAEAAPLQRRPEQVDIRRLAAEVAAALNALARTRGVSIVVEAASEPVTGVTDAGHAARALRNVLTNGVQHTSSGGHVSVSTSVAGDFVELRVTDGGPGIAADDLPHVFERFYRADPSRSAGDTGRPGSGIGLTIARELLSANGGSIAVESSGPSGTTFLLRLPAVR